jgi:DNA-directed RNA polymerase subunit H (RpoH/RPB5)
MQTKNTMSNITDTFFSKLKESQLPRMSQDDAIARYLG